jgi:hypothetical protein
MRIACWVTKAINTHSEYVIIGFPRQQFLHQRGSLLRYTYIACTAIFYPMAESAILTSKEMSG